MGTSSKAAERKVIIELTELLKKNSDRVLSGETNLCLTTSSLSILAVNFRRFSENTPDAETAGSSNQGSKKKEEVDARIWKENIRTLMDFVWKVKALKIIHGSYTMKAPIQISRFRSLQVLEIKRVPIHMVEGLSKLRGQLKEITVSKSLQTLKDLLEICGGDRTPGLVWPHLKTAYLGFNTLQELDQSLNYIPFVEVIDLSHNSITKSADCLQSLLDLMRINLGYNMLKSVPQFSSVNKVKVKTLVLRSNNLESLEGVEELCALEELDVSENFLLDHKVLQALLALKRLQVLCLLGNPLSYKNNHRTLTLQYIYPQAGLGVFLLDGKRLNHHEIKVLQENQYRNIYDQETAGSSNGNGTLGADECDSNIAVSQLSPHGNKKKKGHRRMHSKERIPRITDFEDSLKEESMPKSQGESPSTSYADESEIEIQRQEDERYYETMREHYKDDWLKALSANQKSFELSDQSDSAKEQSLKEELSSSRQNGKKEFSKEENVGKRTSVRTEEQDKGQGQEKDQPVVEAEIHPHVYSPVTSPTSQQEQDFPSVRSPTSPMSPQGVQIGETTDIYSLPKSDKKNRGKPAHSAIHMYSYDSLDGPLSPKEENTEQYGAESEPYIMMLPNEEMKHLIVTINQRFITEKDLSGNKITALDLKCLKNIEKTEEKCYGKDIIGGFVFTILRLDFDYVRKDMRQRRYAVESNEEAERFQSLVSHYVKSKEVEIDTMQCLKCQHEFDIASQDQSTDLAKCPKCASKMVIKSEKVQVRLRADRKTEQKPVEEVKESWRRSWHRSTVRRSVRDHEEILGKSPREHEAGEVTAVDDIDSSKINVNKPDTADRYSLGSSLKDYVDQLIPAVLPDASEEGNTRETKALTSENADERIGQSVMEKSGLKNNSSWADVRKSGMYKSAARDSASSVESDITVLATNSSRGSVAAISESSHEILRTSTTNILSSAGVIGDTDGVIPGKNHTSDNGITWSKDTQRQITPVGSPLSNSVCSSMVSSVYENTLAGSGEDATYREEHAKFKDKIPNQDDSTVAESVPVRRSKSNKLKSRQPNNRNFTVYDQDFSLGESDSRISVVVEDASTNSRESSFYDTSVTSDSTKFEDARDSSVPSIYDTAVSDDNLESSHDYSRDLYSHNSRQSHDQSSANQSASGHSSPLRRKGSSRSRSRSRSSSRNRSAIYVDDSIHEPEDKNNSANIPEFPSELSPIKRTSSSRRSVKNRSAMFIDNNSEISDLESRSVDVSIVSAQNSNETDEVSVQSQETSAQLPWEQSENQSAETSRKDESLNHDEFVNIDHNIKLHLELQVLRADETAQCAIQCDIVQYMKKEAVKSLLVISTHRIMIFRIEGDSPASPDWLKSYEDQPITELRYIDIGLGYQTLRLEFETECSSYTLLIADEGRCKKFLTLISDIVAHSDHSHLERIVKSNPVSLENLEQQVLSTEDDTQPQEMVRFLTVKYSHAETNTDETKTQSLVVTQTDLVLIDENHQWPLPRLQAPLTGDIKGRQFTVVQREKINNIGTLSFNENKPTELQMSFLETTAADNPSTWFITFETMKGVKSFVDAIREPWEEEFGVSLDITSISFTDTSSVMD